MARAFMVAALLALASAPGVRAADGDLLIPMNAKGKYAEVEKPETAAKCAQILGCVDCEFIDKAVGQKKWTEGSFLQCLACDLSQGYVLNTFTGRCDCAPGFGAPLASGQLTSLWKYVPEYVDDTWSQLGVDGNTGDSPAKPILLPDFVWPGKFRYCNVCPAGTYTDGANPIRTRCKFCPRGKTTSGAGCGSGASDCCDYCAPGWRWDGSKCVQCPINTWYPGGPASGDAVASCNSCPANDIGVAGFTLNPGSGSEDQCKQYPVCPGATAASCDDSNYIIRKGFHLGEADSGDAVPTTQHYRKKIGDGETGYYCVACTPGTTTTDCTKVGGTCAVDTDDLPEINPAYKKLRESKKQLKTGHHGHQLDDDAQDDDDELAGVDPVAGYKKIKYEADKKSWDGAGDDDGGDDEGKKSVKA